jgi:hypothetical protein
MTQFRNAGYRDLARLYRVNLRPMEEGPQVKCTLKRAKVHQTITIAKEMAERDFLIFIPKLKTNVLSHGYSGALKLNIGTIDSRERLFNHNQNLPSKIVDILEVANPDLIVTDGIRFSYGGNQMTQHGRDMGVLAVSTNAVAHDMVCASLLNLDPSRVPHIQEASKRGYGPLSMNEIDIVGNFSIEKGQEKTKSLDYGFFPVNQFPSNFHIVTGTPYCTGGCPGIFLDWLHMIRDRKAHLFDRFPRLTVYIGKIEKKVEKRRMLLVGNCASSSIRLRSWRIVRIPGCPPSHKRIVWDMMVRFFLLSPLVRISLIIDGFVLYPLKKFKGWILNLRLKPLTIQSSGSGRL